MSEELNTNFLNYKEENLYFGQNLIVPKNLLIKMNTEKIILFEEFKKNVENIYNIKIQENSYNYFKLKGMFIFFNFKKE